MPGTKLLTKLDAATGLRLAWRTAQDLGYSLTPLGEGANRFTATKGSMLGSFLAGALAPYCAFEISTGSYSDANEIILEKNSPGLLIGKMGLNKVNRQADELIAAIVNAIEREGGTILERKDF
ncbi:MAG: hypothetical protein HYX68_11820 [Planctomycetes bacterium]|jgi:hypothetical protein|nr:hypothetical protein [Planctomycetota bacterium]